jgi:CorA-like Mg2+ transporter protein
VRTPLAGASRSQRPKLDRYPSHLFLTAYASRLDPGTGELATRQLAAFITSQALIPMSEVVGELMRHDLHVVGDDLVPYYRDIYDQVLRAAERIDSPRDLVTSILETNVTIQGNRLNVIRPTD